MVKPTALRSLGTACLALLLLGLVFLPWTTLMYVIVAVGGVTGFDWVWIGLAVISDIVSYSGSVYGNRDRIPGYAYPC